MHVLARLRRAAIGGLGRAAARADASAAAVADLSVAVGTSDGRLRVYAADGVLLLSKRLDSGAGPHSTPSPVRSLRARDARRSPSRDEVSEDLVAALDAAAVKVDAVELRSALRRARTCCSARRGVRPASARPRTCPSRFRTPRTRRWR